MKIIFMPLKTNLVFIIANLYSSNKLKNPNSSALTDIYPLELQASATIPTAITEAAALISNFCPCNGYIHPGMLNDIIRIIMFPDFLKT